MTARLRRAAIAAVLAGASVASADTLWVGGSETTNALEIGRIKVIGVADAPSGRSEDRALVFQSAGGNESRRPLASVVRMEIDDEPSLNAAEAAYAEGKWDAATDDYLKTVRGTTKDWLKRWAGQRLIESAERSGRFDAAAAGYVALVTVNPADATRKPALPDEKSAYLAQAQKDVQAALGNTKLSPPQRQALLSFQLDLQRARKDTRGAAETVEQMLKLGVADIGDPANAAALARLKLDVAAVALDGKQYQKAIDEVQNSRALFTEPQLQADALFTLAEAKYRLAQQQEKPDPQALQEAGLAYMRVVAHFKDAPGRPHVGASLLKTAEIHEKLNDRDAALSLYQQVAAQFNDDPAGPKAKEQIERLKGATAAGAAQSSK
jgi:TolA-binding protein